MSSWIDPQAKICLTVNLGDYVKVWAFAHVMDGTVIGDYCSIGGCAEIGRNCVIGEHTRIGYGVFIPNDTKMGDYCFIGPRVVFTDDKFPIAENTNYNAQPPVIEDHASIGAGAVILPGITIGHHAMIGAGAVVTHDVESYMVVVGNPARHIKVKERDDASRSGKIS